MGIGRLHVLDDGRGLCLLRVDQRAELAARLTDLAERLSDGVFRALHGVVDIVVGDLTQLLDLGLGVLHEYVPSKEDIKPLLIKQVSSSVKWEETIRRMIADGVDTFVEVGPGKALSGFIKKVSRDVKVFNVEDMASLEKTLEGLNA